MKNVIVITLVCLLSLSCNKEAKETSTVGEFKVEFLFEHDGCKMYRFYDGGKFIYYSNCKYKSTTYTEYQEGKNNYVEKSVDTTY